MSKVLTSTSGQGHEHLTDERDNMFDVASRDRRSLKCATQLVHDHNILGSQFVDK